MSGTQIPQRYWVVVFGREVEVKHRRTQRLLAWLMLHITGSSHTMTENQ